MTGNYAQILARVEENDPCFTISETVREESKIYPRPTNIETFKYGLFNINRDELDTHIARTMEQYPDIKLLRASSGGVYLYSTLYMTEDQALLVAEHREHPDR